MGIICLTMPCPCVCLQVIAQDRKALLSRANWGKMVQKVSQFGIRTGTFNCSNDYRLETGPPSSAPILVISDRDALCLAAIWLLPLDLGRLWVSGERVRPPHQRVGGLIPGPAKPHVNVFLGKALNPTIAPVWMGERCYGALSGRKTRNVLYEYSPFTLLIMMIL